MKWLHHFSSLVLVLGMSLVSATAHAQPAEARAREYYVKGTDHFQAGRYLEAQAAYAAGFELSQKPGFIWNMAECARLLGQRERAVELYRKYVHDSPNGPERAEAERHIRTLEPTSPPHSPEPSPTPAPIRPGPAQAAGPLVPRADLAGLSSTISPARANDEGGPPIYRRWWFWTGAGVVVTAAVVTTVILTTGSSASSSPASSKPTGVDWRN